ncbi:flagellar basal body rod protein FlgC [Candidatus Uabimicrobium amorphum]|uniref:Flagellar basal-body rod protein FlgC n=1 Tax=Uabimicrobium amorphum TaxID=2596890 RepID=A0A5S9IQV6_UABAM|nr:flagellar basal body rod protein FlgC [Candidatus Uabimicrobium amorphum]BBM85015.1 flagellar basal-body rod protein FlgC [Candidatus Uabimicrobium amorphum]
MENLFRSLNISNTGIRAERTRMNIIAQNLANVNTTRQNGEKTPYKRKEAIFEELLNKEKAGVVVAEVVEDESSPITEYNPNHPDADKSGYVHKPNIDLHFEMVDLLTAARSYEANLLAGKLFKDIAERTISLE